MLLPPGRHSQSSVSTRHFLIEMSLSQITALVLGIQRNDLTYAHIVKQ